MTQESNHRHIVLLGDSIFDNAKYVPDGLPVITHLRNAIPSEWEATLLAVDGNETHHVFNQTYRLPETATHLIVSVGGNDAISYLPLFADTVGTVGEALLNLAKIRNTFCEKYRQMLKHVLSFNLPVIVCTIHTSVPNLGAGEKTALALFNEVILQEAFLANVPVIDLRLICIEEIDYSEVSPIEPSHAGGQKIARAIYSMLQTHDFGSRSARIISTIDANKKGTFAKPKQLIRRRTESLTDVCVLLPNEYDAQIDAIEMPPGHFISRSFDELETGANGIMWGDEFKAARMNNGLYQFEQMISPSPMIHIQWPIGLCPPYSARNNGWVSLSLTDDFGYNLDELRDYLISLDGALEITEFFQFVAVTAHVPASRENEFLKFIPELCPDLMKIRMEYLEADFSVEDSPFVKRQNANERPLPKT